VSVGKVNAKSSRSTVECLAVEVPVTDVDEAGWLKGGKGEP
jgi:hypothetical protein